MYAFAILLGSLSEPAAQLAASVLLGLSVAWLVWQLIRFMTADRINPPGTSAFERDRRVQLRAGSFVYRNFEPWIDGLVKLAGGIETELVAKFRHDLALSEEPLPWGPREYLASKTLEAGIAGLAGATFGMLLFGDVIGALVVGLLAAWGYRTLMVRGVVDKSNRRLKSFKRRLPYAVDLLALMMEAGAGFQEALGVVVRENQNNAVGQEFGEVLRETSLGKSRREALDTLRKRLADDDVSELIFAIIKGEELGTPLSQVLRVQARQMMMKHSQWIEKESAEAQVLIVFPGMIIMVACMLIISAPFILSAIHSR